MNDPDSGHSIGALAERQMHAVLRDLARTEDLWFDSCLDVGCGRTRYDRWFERFERNTAPARYVGLETDGEIIDQLVAEGVDVRHAIDAPGDCRSDLTLCIEVVEHVLPEDTPAFFEFVAANTEKAMMLTTPNFEYWNGTRALPDYRECRWIPDHLPSFDPRGGPHHHKQAMTPESVRDYLTAAFRPPEWEVRVYRAWPWRLEDEVSRRSFQLYFKIFATAWRRGASGHRRSEGSP